MLNAAANDVYGEKEIWEVPNGTFALRVINIIFTVDELWASVDTNNNPVLYNGARA